MFILCFERDSLVLDVSEMLNHEFVRICLLLKIQDMIPFKIANAVRNYGLNKPYDLLVVVLD